MLRWVPWCGFNDQITSIRVDNLSDDCQNPSSTQVAVFEDVNYNQNSPARDCVLLNVGFYPNPFWNANSGQSGGGYGLNDNQISSALVAPAQGAHARFTMWDLSSYQGAHVSSGTSVPDFRSGNFDGRIVNFNDKMTSLTVSTCSHDICVQGSALPASCGDPCVNAICPRDSFCCNSSWDATCVAEVRSICNFSCS